jgi:hypothetical protein
MRRSVVLVSVCALPLTLVLVLARAQSQHPALAAKAGPDDPVSIHADVVATGIPGAGAIAQIGKFHTGGPFHDNPAFAPSTQPGQVLDGRRLFVASSSNFGAPLARPLEAPGAILSIDVRGGTENPVAVPADFATISDTRAHTIEEAIRAHGGQAAARDAFNTLCAADLIALRNFLGCI